MEALVPRMRALEHRVHEAAAERREEFAGGVAYFSEALRSVWDVNFARLDRECPDPGAEVERLQAGLGHRKLLIEDHALVERFGPGLRERGFAERGLAAMARQPGGELDRDVRELPYDDIVGLRRAVIREQLVPADPLVIDQLIEAARLWTRAGGRWLAVFDDARPVAHCVIYSHEGLAQIEDVAVLRSHRRRGLSRRLLAHALELTAAEHDTVFIQAEQEDWPGAFYARLGFEHVEDRADYLLIVT